MNCRILFSKAIRKIFNLHIVHFLLMLSTLGKNSADDIFLIFSRKQDLTGLSNPVFWKKRKNILIYCLLKILHRELR